MKIDGRPARILVAEDNEVNQQVILGMLKNLGCEADLACDGSIAVNMAIAGGYDVILMDIHMPALDGVTAMQNIRSLLAGASCPPIVAMTAHALPGDRERYLAMGMNDYVSKPIRPGELKSLFERLFADDSGDPPIDAQTPAPIAQNRADGVPPAEELPILDREQLEDLRYLPAPAGSGRDGQDAIGGLIRLFQTKATERMEEMDRLLAGGQWVQLAELAHSLRGSSASMGFPRVAADCKDLELAARQKQTGGETGAAAPNSLDETLARIKFHYAQADAALRQWLLTGSAAGRE